MRKFIISAVVATVAAVSFAAPSQAGGFSLGFGDGYVTVGGYGHGYGHGHHYKKHYKRHYYQNYYEPSCFTKKVKRWDSYGNLRIKRIRVCN
ncbi:hypothetical protein [Pararhizobium sp.]|uniref:hypothetical protein n=1 Tax=Pararhizobium sp. TaxID=1977563 RepID=UPI00271C0439|nr:hypothetical protein [Pararhizobium sp.]MDO9414822.1 hypothetical protein [Pararhizobium sp.]